MERSSPPSAVPLCIQLGSKRISLCLQIRVSWSEQSPWRSRETVKSAVRWNECVYGPCTKELPCSYRTFWVSCPNRMVAISYRLSIIKLVTSFCVTFSIPDSIGGWYTGNSGYVAKAGDLNHRLVVIFSVVCNAGYRKSLHALVRVCLSPTLSVHLL